MRALYMQLWQDLGYLARPVASATASRTSLAAESSASTGVMVAEALWEGEEEIAAFFCRGPVRRSAFFALQVARTVQKMHVHHASMLHLIGTEVFSLATASPAFRLGRSGPTKSGSSVMSKNRSFANSVHLRDCLPLNVCRIALILDVY